MSFPSKQAYLQHKASGNMPAGGPYPDFEQLNMTPRDSLLSQERAAQARQLLDILREHPGDMRIHKRLDHLTGGGFSIAQHHTQSYEAEIIAAARDQDTPPFRSTG